MGAPRSTTSHRQRRHASSPRPWSQFGWTLLGMAFITALFLSSGQSATSTVDTEIQAPYDYSLQR